MFMHVYVSHVVKQNNTNDLLHATLNFGSVDYAECGVRSVENVECGKCVVWKMRSVENEECGK